MAKKTAEKLTIQQVALMAPLARDLGVATSTLNSAISNGYVESVELGCGSKVVVIESAKEWVKSPRKRGPKSQ